MSETVIHTDRPDADVGVFVEPTGDLDNFHVVADGTIYRGARPTAAGIAHLKALGVRTIINLENFPRRIRQGRRWAQAHGISYISLPMNVFAMPSRRKAERFLRMITDPANQPVYFHCMQGRDRTGAMAYVYRIRACGWSHTDAYAEMKRHGFHTYLLGLKSFVYLFGLRFGRREPPLAGEPTP